MQKELTKKSIETAKPYFEHYPKTTEVMVVEDGNVFLDHNKADGSAYAASNKLAYTLVRRDDLETFQEESEEDDKDTNPTAKWTVEKIKEWLTEREVIFEPTAKKADLLKLVEDFNQKD